MKNIILLSSLLLLMASCFTGIMDKPFSYDFYENLDYEKLLVSEDINDDDLFLLNYCIIRQRDYFNFTIEGKPYREILEMAKDYHKNGFPVEFKLNDNTTPSDIEQKIEIGEAIGFAKKGGKSKRILKTLNFECNFKNPTDKDVVLLNGSFIVKGPFGDYITTVNYEINCILEANSSVIVPVVVPGKTIQKNIMYEGNPRIQRLGIDKILSSLSVEPSGLSTKDQGRYFKDCFFNAARLQPHGIVNFSKDLKEVEWKTLGADGKYELSFGDMHIPDLSDETIQMR